MSFAAAAPIVGGALGLGASLIGGSKKPKQQNFNTEFASPYGSSYTKDGKTQYQPKLSPLDRQNFTDENYYINQATRSLPSSFNVNDYYNNPFYESTLNQYRAPILDQYARDQHDMTDNLNARGLLGGSFEALMRDKSQRERDSLLGQAADQARMGSANAYQQQFNNSLNQISGLRGDQLAFLQRLYYPQTVASGVQQNSLNAQNLQQQQSIYGQQQQQNTMGNVLAMLPLMMKSFGNK